jgi:hemerythrin-like domain-containing protein
MADVFQVLKQDHDEIKAMLTQLHERPRATAHEQLASRQRLVERVITGRSTHEAAEERYFWPALRKLGSDGNRIADLAIEQEAEAARVLSELAKLDPGDRRFDERLAAFSSSARAHILLEEAYAWPLLAETVSAGQAEALGVAITQAKAMAPAPPHPGPRAGLARGPANAIVPLQGFADRLRDAVAGWGRTAR